MKRNFLYHLFIIVFISLNIYAQAGYEEFNCYIDDSNFNEQSFSDGVVAQPAIEGSADLAILLCVENGQDKTVPYDLLIEGLLTDIPDYFEKATFGDYDINVNYILVESTDIGNNTAEAFELSGMLIPEPPIGANFVVPTAMVNETIADADDLYDFNDFDSDNDGIVDFFAFIVIRFASGNANGTAGLPFNGFYTTDDPAPSGGNVRIDGRGYLTRAADGAIIQRKRSTNPDDIISILVHEMGHALFDFPDMDHAGTTFHDHYGIGNFCSMSASVGFLGFNHVASLYNPVFRVEQDWVTPANLSSSTTLTFTDFDQTGQIYEYVLPDYGNNVDNQRFYITYYNKPVNNKWQNEWPIPEDASNNARGVLIWHTQPGTNWSQREFLPIDIESAHGKWEWIDDSPDFDPPNDVYAIVSSTQNPLTGLDSLEVRFSYIGFFYDPEHPYAGTSGYVADPFYSDYRLGSESVFFNPLDSQDFSFYSNPNSNGYDNGAGYSSSYASSFKMENLRLNGISVQADIVIGNQSSVISEDITLIPGLWSFSNDVEVAQGVTLTIPAGTTLEFHNGSSLVANGHLQINGTSGSNVTFDFDSPNSTTQNGIKINPGATITATYTNIQNAYRGIYFDESYGTVNYCTFEDCTEGLRFYRTNYAAQQPNLNYNTVFKNSYDGSGTGIACSYSSPYMTNNEVYNCYTGIGVIYNSSPYLGYSSAEGRNNLHDNYKNLHAISSSNPFLGSTTYEGYNKLEDAANLNLLAQTNCNILAEINWWGSSDQQTIESTISTSSSTVDFIPFLNSSPFRAVIDPGLIQALNKTTNENNELFKAQEFIIGKEYEKSLQIINKYKNSIDLNDALFTFDLILQLKRAMQEDGLSFDEEHHLNSIKELNKNKIVAGMIDLYRSSKVRKNFTSIEEIKNNYKQESEVITAAQFTEFMIHLNELNDYVGAKNILITAYLRNNEHPLVEAATELLEDIYPGIRAELPKSAPGANEITKQVNEYALFANYPNPRLRYS